MALPFHFKRGALGPKHLLRKVLYRHVPRALVERPKQGFGVPLAQWLRGRADAAGGRLPRPRAASRRTGCSTRAWCSACRALFARGDPSVAQKVWLLLAFQMWQRALDAADAGHARSCLSLASWASAAPRSRWSSSRASSPAAGTRSPSTRSTRTCRARGRARGTGVELIVDQKRLKLDPAVLVRLRRKIAGWRADIVHGFLFDGDIYARIAAVGTACPVLNSERSDNYTISRSQRWPTGSPGGWCDGVVANSTLGQRFAQRLYGYRPAPDARGLERHAHRRFERRLAVTDWTAAASSSARAGTASPAWSAHQARQGLPPGARRGAPHCGSATRLARALPGSLGGAGAYQAGRDSDTSGYKRSVMAHYEALGLSADRVRFAGAAATPRRSSRSATCCS